MNIYRALARASVARNLPINLNLIRHKDLRSHLWAEGTTDSNFLASAKASVARNLKWALLLLKGTIK